MKQQFVALFDVKKYRFNFWAALALFVANAIGWILIMAYVIDRDPILDLQSFNLLRYFFFSALYWIVFAMTFTGLAHWMKGDFFFPGFAALIMVGWRMISSAISGSSLQSIFDISNMAIEFCWTFFPLTAIVIFYKIIPHKLWAILTGYVVGIVFARVLTVLIISDSLFNKIILINLFEAALTGLLLYLALSLHFKRKGLQIGEELTIKAEPAPELPKDLQFPIVPKFLSQINLSIGWSFYWRIFLASLGVSLILSVFLAILPQQVSSVLFFERSRTSMGGGQNFISYWFIGSPIIMLILANWFSKITLKKRYHLVPDKFVGWSVWWRIVLLNLAGLFPLLFFATLIPNISLDSGSGTAAFGFSVLLYFPLLMIYLLYAAGWAIHSLLRIIPKERWTFQDQQRYQRS